MIVGIDLGTCYSAVGYGNLENNVELVPNFQGNRITPSVVAISAEEILVGEEALIVKDDSNFVFIEKSKTFIGTNKIYATPQGSFTPEKISELILSHLKSYTEDFLKSNIDKAVITVPAYFSIKQRNLTKIAAENAGIEVMKVLSEPTAASLNFKNNLESEYILAFDLGGGTFDSSLLVVNNMLSKVISTHGNTNLGGQDFDRLLASTLVPNYEFLSAYEKIELNSLCESAKKQLSVRESVYIHFNKVNSKLLPYNLTLQEFDSITKPLVDLTKECVFKCMKDADLSPSDINKVLLVGGSTRLRSIKKLLSGIFTCPIETLGNPDESVAIGATIHAMDISGTKYSNLLIDVIPLSISVRLDNGFCKKLIRRNTPIPCSNEEIFTTAFDNQEKVSVEVYQGENELSKNNNLVGKLFLDNIKKGLKGEAKISVRFDIDQNAVLSVKALDLDTNSLTTATFDFNFDSDNKKIDESYDIAIQEYRFKLEEIKLKFVNDTAIINTIESALASNNIEFLRATYEDLT